MEKQAHIYSRAFLAVLVIFTCYLLATPYKFLPYDAGEYWSLAESFVVKGEFSLLYFKDPLRGYLFPLLLLPLVKISYLFELDPLPLNQVSGAIQAALFFAVAVPLLVRSAFPSVKITFARILVFSCLGFLFWRDYFSFPLTDFPALLALTASMVFLLKQPGAGSFLLSGLFFGAACNFRPLYIVSLPLLVFILVLKNNRNYGYRNLMYALTFLLGILFIGLPQFLLNSKHRNIPSPLVQAQLPDEKKSLYLWQIGWGIFVQKYETTIDPTCSSGRIIYADPVGENIIAQENLFKITDYGDLNLPAFQLKNTATSKDLESFTQYVALVIKYPFQFSGIYLRHLFNGLDVGHATPYIKSVAAYNPFLTFLNFSVWFLALLVTVKKYRKVSKLQVLVLLALITPCLVVIPTAVECRYLLSLHIIAYALVAFGLPLSWPIRQVFTWKLVPVLLGYCLFTGCSMFVSFKIRQHAVTRCQQEADR
jgi:hypothetical protein